jgi:hypothetical protein
MAARKAFTGGSDEPILGPAAELRQG